MAVLAAFLPVRAGGSLWWHECPHHFGALAAAAGGAPVAPAAVSGHGGGSEHAGHAHHTHHADHAQHVGHDDYAAADAQGHGGHGDQAAGCTCTAYDCGGHGIALAAPVLHVPTPIAGEERRLEVVPALLPRAVRWTLPFAQGPPVA